MSLFQTAVINQYLKKLDKKVVENAYAIFKLHFHNATLQENIKNSKEEQYQGEFLIDLFVNVLGYTKNPSPNFNLTTEYKNVKDSKKADGAILINGIVKAVIELKGTNTTDLSKIETQAFGYKNNQLACVYIITSNFEKLRFYIDNATEYLEFNLFKLSESEFALLYLCLSFDSIEKGIPKKIKEDSLSREDAITKKLYADYSIFKRELYQNLVALNPQFEGLVLFQKSQKLLDRFLFLFFAEDRQLLPPNSVRLILNDWRDLQERDVAIPLYDRFKKYFEYLNTGYEGKRYNVFAYNGGLFKPDAILDVVQINDELLFKYALKLSEYDFASEVDVNILGHIFENSLNELDEIKAQLEGKSIDKTKTKRKKDGVFYTPKYITKYIVDNTVGKLCIDKKTELLIVDEDYVTDKKRPKKTTQLLANRLTDYRNWLLQITICDPACGSGAFLNQALDFLITEHRYIDELQAKLFGDAFVLNDIENSILENNLFGVDLNEESVEIAKLSLWLRTAKPNRKLNDLNNNIKCGNSLIDDYAIAGDKAFNWQREFPQVFGEYVEEDVKIDVQQKIVDNTDSNNYITNELNTTTETEEANNAYSEKITNTDYRIINTDLNIVNDPVVEYNITAIRTKGFDVVIGNPPYVNAIELKKNISTDEYTFLKDNYETAKGTVDLYIYFFERSFKIVKQNSFIAFITPNRFLSASYGQALREYIINHLTIETLIDYSDKSVFAEASTYPVISIFRKRTSNEYIIKSGKVNSETKEIYLRDYHSSKLKLIDEYIWGFLLNDKLPITEKVISISESLSSVGKINATSTAKEADDYSALVSNTESGLKLINTGTIDPYITTWGVNYLTDKGLKFLTPYLKSDIEVISKNRLYLYNSPKIIISKIGLKCEAYFDKQGTFASINTNCIHSFNSFYLPEYILCWINSKLYNYIFECLFDGLRMSGGYLLYSAPNLKNTYIKKASLKTQQPFIQKADEMLALNNELQEITQKFQSTIKRKFDLVDLSSKLQNWYLISYTNFIKELANKKIKLSFSDEADWEAYFKQQSNIALDIKAKINATDKAIDAMVYELYNLTEAEIEILENA